MADKQGESNQSLRKPLFFRRFLKPAFPSSKNRTQLPGYSCVTNKRVPSLSLTLGSKGGTRGHREEGLLAKAAHGWPS
jgi:hypothetical protein